MSRGEWPPCLRHLCRSTEWSWRCKGVFHRLSTAHCTCIRSHEELRNEAIVVFESIDLDDNGGTASPANHTERFSSAGRLMWVPQVRSAWRSSPRASQTLGSPTRRLNHSSSRWTPITAVRTSGTPTGPHQCRAAGTCTMACATEKPWAVITRTACRLCGSGGVHHRVPLLPRQAQRQAPGRAGERCPPAHTSSRPLFLVLLLSFLGFASGVIAWLLGIGEGPSCHTFLESPCFHAVEALLWSVIAMHCCRGLASVERDRPGRRVRQAPARAVLWSPGGAYPGPPLGAGDLC